MIEKLKENLNNALTQFHSIEIIKEELKNLNYQELNENEIWHLNKNGKYFTIKDGSSLIAFKLNDLTNYGFNIIASHSDSPVLKIKGNPEIKIHNYTKFNIEVYGGTLLYTWLDKPLKIAGRVVCKNKITGCIESILYNSSETFIIPSVAIHLNREANNGLKLNPQVDLLPLIGLDEENVLNKIIYKQINENQYEILDFDLNLYNSSNNFFAGVNNEFLCSPRIDNLTSAFASIEALVNSNDNAICVCAIFNNEEIGSQTKQGAAGKFLYDTLKRINLELGYDERKFLIALSNSFMVSCDNAHAIHPNNAGLSDPTNKVLLGKGIVIKHHANFNYTTDAFSSSIFKQILINAKIAYQDFYMRSDLRCGGTLGAISSSQLSIQSVDIGLPQLAMHSNMETMCCVDYITLVQGLTEFYNTLINCKNYKMVDLKK